jgi:hypothetical protein
MAADWQGDVLITDFTGGELSPRWFSRVQRGGMDPLQGGGTVSANYESGCRDITNMLVLPQGGVSKRTGTLFGRNLSVDIPGVDLSTVVVFKLEFPGGDFITVWAPLIVKVYSTVTFSINVDLGSPIASFATPYDVTDLRVMQVAQLQDSIVVFDNHHRSRVLRVRAGVWSFTDVQNTGSYVAPLYDFRDTLSPPSTFAKFALSLVVNTDKAWNIINVSSLSVAGGVYFTIIKNSPTTTRTNIETALKAVAAVLPSSVIVTWTGSGQILNFDIQYNFLGSVGDATGQLTLLLSNPVSGESVTITTLTDGTSGAEPLWSGPGVILHNAVYYRCILAHLSVASNEPGVGVNQATYWTSLGASLPAGTDWTTLNAGKAWSIDQSYATYNRGWPSTGTAHEQRLVANGPPAARGVIAGSRTGIGQFLNFTTGTNANDAFVFLLVVANGLSVVWLHSQKILYVGTSVGVFAQTQVPMAPTSVNFSRQSNYSLGDVRGFDVAGEVFFVQRNGRQMRRMQFINDLQAYQASDMTAYAEHMWTEGRRIKDFAYINSPDSILFLLRSDGSLMSFTYERFYGVAAWTKNATQGGMFIAIESFFGGVAQKDMVVLATQRSTWNGAAFVDQVFLEILSETSRNEWGVEPNTAGGFDYATLDPSLWFARLDAVQIQTGNGTTSLTVASRFFNKAVTVQADGVDYGTYTASVSGAITVAQPIPLNATVYIGYKYPAKIVPVQLEVASKNTAQAATQRWARPMFRLFASAMPVVNGVPIRERSVADLYDEVSGLYTGDVNIANLGTGGELEIECNEPLPYQITGLFGLLSVNGGDD